MVGEVHDTLSRMWRFGLGVGSIVHAWPFQASVSASTVAKNDVNE
jgi:hypothetical protein